MCTDSAHLPSTHIVCAVCALCTYVSDKCHVSLCSVPGLVSQRLMVMTFIDGTPLMQLRDKVAHLPKWKRDKVRAGWRTVSCCQQDILMVTTCQGTPRVLRAQHGLHIA